MRLVLLLSAATLLAGAATTTALADTLQDALAQAYRTNPSLTGARANQRAIDEGVPQAKAQGRPRLSIEADLFHNYTDAPLADRHTTSVAVGPVVSMPIYQGGGVRSSIKAAEQRVEAGRADLRATEAQTFVDVVAAYLDVIRAERVVDLNNNQVSVLGTNLQASKDRFEVGDLTRTDVAQSEARLAGARSALTAAEGDLTIARENYLRVIGDTPDDLQSPPPLPPLPESADVAVELALAGNPDLLAAKAAERAAGYDVRSAQAGQLPTLSAAASGTYSDYLGTNDEIIPGISARQSQKSAQVGLTARIPLYEGGAVASRTREARARQSQAMEQVVLVERGVVNQARASFANLQTARAVKASSETAVSANKLALEGVRAENSVGTRDVLDVLNAEQELLNSEVSLVTAQRDEYVAGFALLAAVGQAEARNLGLEGGALYDPVANYRRVRNSISDWSTGSPPKPEATRTVGPQLP